MKNLTPLLLLLVLPGCARVLESNFTASREHGQLTACKSNLKNIGTACEMYSTDFEGRYPLTMAQVTPNYLKTVPTCASAHTDTYSATFVSTQAPAKGSKPTGKNALPDAYTFYCSGHHHDECPPDYPMYNSWTGLVTGGSQPK